MYLFYRPKKKLKAERVENGRMKPIENLFVFINEIENDFPGLSSGFSFPYPPSVFTPFAVRESNWLRTATICEIFMAEVPRVVCG